MTRLLEPTLQYFSIIFLAGRRLRSPKEHQPEKEVVTTTSTRAHRPSCSSPIPKPSTAPRIKEERSPTESPSRHSESSHQILTVGTVAASKLGRKLSQSKKAAEDFFNRLIGDLAIATHHPCELAVYVKDI